MINAAIVGLGRWGRHLVDSVQGRSGVIRFVAGMQRNAGAARDYADRCGLVLYDDYPALLRDPRVDAVVLATPHTAHAGQIVLAAAAGKSVFTEKPFTLSQESARSAIAACAAGGVTLAVGYNWRFQPALREMRRLFDTGALGKLLHVEGNFCGPSVYRFGQDHWRQSREEGPAGGLTGRGVHVIDAMLYLAGHVESVHAQSHRFVQSFGIDDTTSVLFRFLGDATGYLGTVTATAETWRIQVFGSRGCAQVGSGGLDHLATWPLTTCFVDPQNPAVRPDWRTQMFPESSTERAELEHFADAVAKKRPLAVAGGDEEHGVAVLDAILASSRARESVKVARP
jgi:predicted dehydrogenase